jgi:hypothetical protein
MWQHTVFLLIVHIYYQPLVNAAAGGRRFSDKLIANRNGKINLKRLIKSVNDRSRLRRVQVNIGTVQQKYTPGTS